MSKGIYIQDGELKNKTIIYMLGMLCGTIQAVSEAGELSDHDKFEAIHKSKLSIDKVMGDIEEKSEVDKAAGYSLGYLAGTIQRVSEDNNMNDKDKLDAVYKVKNEIDQEIRG